MPTNTSWTPKQAGYQLYTTWLTDQDGLPRQYVQTRHGQLARTWVGSTAEVVLKRPRNQGATYQGSVRPVPGGWQACDDGGAQQRLIGAVQANYLDAEALLLRLRTGRPVRGHYTWIS